MADYQHILFATDLSEECGPIGEHLADMARHYQAQLSLVHVLKEPDVGINVELDEIPAVPIQGDTPEVKEARSKLATLGKRLAVPEDRQWVVMAHSVADQIHHVAEVQGADLIAVGTHGRHGLALLRGSTSTAVLHGSPCDVLAVRVKS